MESGGVGGGGRWGWHAVWALTLLLVRWSLSLDAGVEQTRNNSDATTSSDDASAHQGPRLHNSDLVASTVVVDHIEALQAVLQQLSDRSFAVRDVNDATLLAAMEEHRKTLGNSDKTVDNTNVAAPPQQQVHASDAYLRQPRPSGIPPLVDNEVFCDQLFNTIPIALLGGEVPKQTMEAWCYDGLLEQGSGDHLPPSVEDAHLVSFTLMQVFRLQYIASQFEDRLIRFRELFAPMIDAMEKRHDRMLYNYI